MPRRPETANLKKRVRLRCAVFFLALSAATGILAALPSNVVAQAASASEASEEYLKAAYLLKFINYVEWPPALFPQADSPYVIGVLDDEVIADELARLVAGRTFNHRGVVVKRLQSSATLAGIHILFISRAERTRQQQILRQLRTQPVLSVTEIEGSLQQGSVINFQMIDQRVRFELSLDAANTAGLKLSSRLFGVATNVVKGTP